VSVSAGASYSCAVIGDGRVACWGSDDHGQLGDGDARSAPGTVVWVEGVTDARAVSTGDDHTCVLLQDGTVRCWGGDALGQLGTGDVGPSQASPLPVSGVSDAIAVAAGAAFTCVLGADGRVTCWGARAFGRLGDGSPCSSGDVGAPASVPGLGHVIDLHAGVSHACAVRSDGAVLCWGGNAGGAADPTEPESCRPVATVVAGLPAVVAAATGSSHTCARSPDGAVLCWGSNASGQLGSEAAGTGSSAPVTVTGLPAARAIAAGGEQTCALAGDGVWCWGLDHVDATLTTFRDPITTPAELSTEWAALAGADGIAVGTEHACADAADGHAVCWGQNVYGQLGRAACAGGCGDAPAVVAGVP